MILWEIQHTFQFNMNRDIVPGRVYLLKNGCRVLVATVQLTPTGLGHGDMLVIATLKNGPSTWTEDITDVALKHCTDYNAVTDETGAVTFFEIANPQPPLNMAAQNV